MFGLKLREDMGSLYDVRVWSPLQKRVKSG